MRRCCVVLATVVAVAAQAAGQEDEPRTGVPGEVSASAVVNVRELKETPPSRPEPVIGGLIHVPLRRPPDSLRPVPEGLRAPFAPPEREVLPLGPSPALTESFLAQPDSNTHIPPDTHGAVGPNHLMVTLNSQIRFQNRSGGLIVQNSLNGFWSAVNGGGGTFDPRTLYDPYANRWISVACDDPRSASSAILVGASQTGDPTGLWHQFRIDADATDTVWADFPSVGFNSKWIVVQLNMFTFAGSYVRSNIYVFDRSALYGGTATFNVIPDTNGFTQAPAVTYDMAQSDLFMVEEWNGGAGALRLTKISGPVGAPAYSVVSMPIGPAWQGAPPASDHAPQSGSVERIATNDARVQNVVFRNGKLWATHTVFAGTPGPVGRASVQWWQLSTAGAVLQNGRIDDPSGTNFYAFPSIAVNKLDDALLGFSCFAGTRFASACYAFRKASDAPNTFQDVATLKEGLASYYKIFTGSVNRWGDYSASQVDPVNDVDLWTIQEYAASPANLWSTWWGHLALPPNVTIGDVSVAEGNSGNVNAQFTISLSFPSTQLVEVDWVAGNGSATLADSDFQSASGRASFPPGTTTQVVNVPVVGDTKLEPNETFVVDLSSPLFGVITDAQGQGTILNDDSVPRMSIDDVRVVEGNAGTANAVFTVTLSNPSGALAQAAWSTANGTAIAPGDYQANSGTVSFTPGTTSQTLVVLVQGDVAPEPHETFRVDLSSPVGAVLGESRGIGTILDDDGATNPDVSAFTIVSDGASGATSGRNRLQWVNPIGGSPIELRIRYNKGNGCTPPDPGQPNTAAFGLITLGPGGAPGEPRFHEHGTLDLDTSYCYTFWVIHTGPVASPGVSAIGRPFNAGGNLKWKYATNSATTGVAPPTVGVESVIAVDNSGDVHGMRRSAAGGTWPTTPAWNPLDLASPSQARNPIIPTGAGSRAFIATQDGRVHAVDSVSGALHWSRQLSPAAAQGAPAGIFTAFGGEHDAVFEGTSAANDNVFHALDPGSGAPIAAFGFPANPGIGPILGMAVVDYTRSPQNRVYFASQQGSAPETLWCVELGPPGPVSFSLKWKVDLGDISGSPVLRNGRIYVGTDAGEVKSVRADDGGDVRTAALGDGPVRGFVFPDRLSSDLYASTNGKVWRLADPGTGTALNVLWAGGISVPNPSPPLLRPGSTHLYVGGGDGKLYELFLPVGSVKSLPLDYDPTSFVVGAPSFDSGFDFVLVGSVRGVFYGVQVPLP